MHFADKRENTFQSAYLAICGS